MLIDGNMSKTSAVQCSAVQCSAVQVRTLHMAGTSLLWCKMTTVRSGFKKVAAQEATIWTLMGPMLVHGAKP